MDTTRPAYEKESKEGEGMTVNKADVCRPLPGGGGDGGTGLGGVGGLGGGAGGSGSRVTPLNRLEASVMTTARERELKAMNYMKHGME